MSQVIEYDTRKTLYSPNKREKRKNLHCGSCGQVGHDKKNKSCIMHEDTRTAFIFIRFEEVCDGPERVNIQSHRNAYVSSYETESKKGFDKMTETYH